VGGYAEFCGSFLVRGLAILSVGEASRFGSMNQFPMKSGGLQFQYSPWYRVIRDFGATRYRKESLPGAFA